jgi:Na+/glutamate symporter
MQPSDPSAKPAPGLFRALYDLSFREFITPQIIGAIYIIALIVAGLWSLGLLLAGFGTANMAAQLTSFGQPPNGSLMFLALVQIVGAPIVFLLLSVATRVYLEVAMALFRIVENTDALRRQE